MIKKIVLWIIVLLVLVAVGGVAYFYYPGAMPGASILPPAAVPDNSVMAGPVQTISEKSITIKKQDGTSVTFTITSATHIVIEGSGATSTTAGLSNKTALITPSTSNPAQADTIVIVSSPPASTH